MWSRSWWYSNPQRRRMRRAPHLFLTTDHIPREIQNTEFRTETNRDGKKWIILLELELLPESRLAQKVTFTEPSVLFLRRDMGPQADTTLIKRWIDTCKGHVHSRMTTDVPVEDDLSYHKKRQPTVPKAGSHTGKSRRSIPKRSRLDDLTCYGIRSKNRIEVPLG